MSSVFTTVHDSRGSACLWHLCGKYAWGWLCVSNMLPLTVTGHFSKHGSQDHAVHWGTPHSGTWHGGWRWIKGSYSFLAWHWERQCPLHEKGNQGRCSWLRAVSVITQGGASAAQEQRLLCPGHAVWQAGCFCWDDLPDLADIKYLPQFWDLG